MLPKSTRVQVASSSFLTSNDQIFLHGGLVKEHTRHGGRQVSPRRALWKTAAEGMKLALKCRRPTMRRQLLIHFCCGQLRNAIITFAGRPTNVGRHDSLGPPLPISVQIIVRELKSSLCHEFLCHHWSCSHSGLFRTFSFTVFDQ